MRGDFRELKRRGDVDAMVDRAVDRAGVRVEAMRAFRRLTLIRWQQQAIGDVDAADDEHVALFLDLADRFRRQEPFSGWDLARLQRTAKGAGQSAGRRGDQIVERRVARLVHPLVDAVVLGHGRVHAELDGL
jgi:hypothetical protein